MLNLNYSYFLQMICLPVGPKCDDCKLSATGLCPSARKGTSPKKRTSRDFQGAKIEIALDDTTTSTVSADSLIITKQEP